MIFFSCENQLENSNTLAEKSNDSFYTSSKEGDLYRIPLIKPIQVISSVGIDSDWLLRLPYQSIDRLRQIKVDSLTVVDSVIIIDAGLVSLPGETTQAWFIIDNKNRTEKIYTTKEAYIKDLVSIGTKEDTKLYEVNGVYRKFKEKGKTPW